VRHISRIWDAANTNIIASMPARGLRLPVMFTGVIVDRLVTGKAHHLEL